MSIVTVTGEVPREMLGVTSVHEHVLINVSKLFMEFDEASQNANKYKKVSIENLSILRSNPTALRDNLILDDEDLAEEELMKFKKAGGNTIVDVTNIGIGRDVKALYRISRATGVNIVAGSGYYIRITHPPGTHEKSIDEIKEEIITDLKYGVGETGIRAGVIGEVAFNWTLHPDEAKILTASAMAQRETGAGLQVHGWPWVKEKGDYTQLIEVLKLLLKNGADPAKICINHIDGPFGFDLESFRTVLNMGAFVEFDNFGHESYVRRDDRERFHSCRHGYDFQRVETIKSLIDDGYINQIMFTSDVCLKTLLCKYGGWGYGHILDNIIPMMFDYGITRQEVNHMLIDNTARFLDPDG
ncbi:MAG: hypothetical protein FWH55_01555 [Oscillospiraceae bacterium]|nr:hypothetical protein [Oscillospiraceae bacterium]